MSGKKSIIIVTDGTQKITKMAEDIAIALKENTVLIKDASSFNGTDLLPAHVIFLGCEEPSPPSFHYLEDLFKHINLASRLLGIFTSGSEKTVKYLVRMVRDSEATLFPTYFLAEKSGDIFKWSTMVLAGN